MGYPPLWVAWGVWALLWLEPIEHLTTFLAHQGFNFHNNEENITFDEACDADPDTDRDDFLYNECPTRNSIVQELFPFLSTGDIERKNAGELAELLLSIKKPVKKIHL